MPIRYRVERLRSRLLVGVLATLAVILSSLGITALDLTRGTEYAAAVGDQVVITSVVSGDGTLSFTYALADSAFTGITDYQYRYRVSPRGSYTVGPLSSWISIGTTSTSAPLVLTGLTNGDNYNVQIVAVNGSGLSTGSFDGGRPYKPAGPPTINSATTDNGKITVNLTPPTDDGGSSVTTYFYQLKNITVGNWVDGSQLTPVNNTLTINNVGNNITYRVRICANTGAGNIVGACNVNMTFSNEVEVVMPVAAILSLTRQPSGAVNTEALTTQPQVQLKDIYSQNLSVAGVQVTATVDAGNGSVVSGTALTNASGLATFSGLTLNGIPAAGFKLKFSIPNLSTPVTSNAFELAKQSQSTLTLSSPSSGVAGEVVSLSASGGSGTGDISFTRSPSSTCTLTNNSGSWTATLGDASSLCVITANRASDTYFLSKASNSATVTISKRSQSLAFTSNVPTSPLAGDVYTPIVSSSQSLVPTLTSTTTGVCTFSGNALSFLTAGTCIIRATQLGDANVLAAQAMEQTIVVGMRNQNITFPTLGNVFYGASSFQSGATVDSGLPLLYSSSNPSVCSVGAATGVISVSSTGTSNATCTITVSQSTGNASYAPANTVSRSFQVEVYVPPAEIEPTEAAPSPLRLPQVPVSQTPSTTPSPSISQVSTLLLQPSGTVGALINGVPVMPKVHIQENSVEIEIPRVVSLTVWAESSDGVKEQLKSESKIVISQGSELFITGDGFMPQSPMTTSVDDNSNVLGTGTAASAGTISGRYGVSSAAMLGDRVIRFSGISSDGHAVTVAMGVTIIAAVAEDSPEAIAQNKAADQQDFTVAIVLGSSAAVFLLLLAFYLRRRKQTQD